MDSATFGMFLDLTSDNKNAQDVCISWIIYPAPMKMIWQMGLILSSSLKLIQCRITGHTLENINRLDVKMIEFLGSKIFTFVQLSVIL